MTTVYDIECDICSGKVIDYVEEPKVQYEKIKASQYVKQKSSPQWTHNVHYYTHHKLVCTECGHIEKYHV